MDIEMVEYYHNKGQMPDWAYYQQNGKSAFENYTEQTRKMKDKFLKREKLEKYKKQLEEQTFESIMIALEDVSSFEDNIAGNIANKIQSVFEGGSIHSERLTSETFSTQLGAALGRALAQAPFKLLDEIFDDNDYR